MTDQPDHISINTFIPKAGQGDQLLKMQLEEIEKLRGSASKAGWIRNEVFRAKDGDRMVIVTRFRSEEANKAWAESPEFAAHLDQIGPLVEHVESVTVEPVASYYGVGRETPLKLAVITGSTREGRFGDKPASWIAQKASAYGGFDVTEIDLRNVSLPFLGDPGASAEQKKAVETFGSTIDAFDAYLFTVAEYNHAPTAVLKNALDHAEWRRKPGGFVGYGGVGGARAVEHMRGIAAELEMVTMQAAVHINFAEYLPVAEGKKQLSDFAHLEDAAAKMLGQLQWWGVALREARAGNSV